ncbi:hypothetical protein QQ054_07235 [Oscillatoria amoena NRMC-F 0135]|nr:hypothetical protein [Oscillatoria amoena NRMC-F 0135]
MKIRTNLAILLSVLSIFCVSHAYGQDDRLPDLDYATGNRGERVETSPDGLSDVESRVLKGPANSSSTSAVIARDTLQARATPKRTDAKPKSDQDASVLNFNFLYYLIERFKLSDIVD